MGDQAVERIDICLSRRNNDIAICSTTSEHLTVCSGNANSYLAQSIDSTRNALDRKLGKLVFDIDNLVNSLVQSVNRTGTDRTCNKLAAFRVGKSNGCRRGKGLAT